MAEARLPDVEARLPDFLRPRSASRFERVGRANDGGYMVDSRDLVAANGLISLGINDDWSFDRAFVRRNAVPVHGYDGSISRLRFARRLVAGVLKRHSLQGIRDSAALLVGFVTFFSGRNRHFKRFVGNGGGRHDVTMTEVLHHASSRHLSRPFLKIDIEGSEYTILDELVHAAPVTTGLVIEFHDCDQHLEEIRGFIAAYPLRLAHVHANNYSPIGAGGIPKVLELTFSSSEGLGQASALPHALDMPNDKDAPEIALSFN